MPRESPESWAVFLKQTLARCDQLISVDLANNSGICTTLQVFSKLQRLRSLNLGNCHGIHGTLEPLSNLLELRTLKFAGCVQLAGDVGPLKKLSKLEQINLEACFGLRGSVEPLSSLQNLIFLNVEDTLLEVGDEFRSKCRSGCVVGRDRVNGTTPLSVATFRGHLSMVKVLLGMRCEVNQGYGSSRHQQTPLMVACYRGIHDDIANELLLHGAMVNKVDAMGASALHLAAERGRSKCASKLIQHGADLDAVNHTGWSPLMFAAKGGHIDIIELLISSRSSVNKLQTNAYTPLVAATRAAHPGVVQLLLSMGADKNEGIVRRGKTRTALDFAMENEIKRVPGAHETLQILKDAGVVSTELGYSKAVE